MIADFTIRIAQLKGSGRGSRAPAPLFNNVRRRRIHRDPEEAPHLCFESKSVIGEKLKAFCRLKLIEVFAFNCAANRAAVRSAAVEPADLSDRRVFHDPIQNDEGNVNPKSC